MTRMIKYCECGCEKEVRNRFVQGHHRSMLNKHHSAETRRKISLAKKGCIPWNKDKTKVNDIRLLEAGKKVSLSNKGKHLSEETRKKMRKPKSLEARKHISDANWNRGKTKFIDIRLLEAGKKISVANKNPSKEIRERMSKEAIERLEKQRKERPYYFINAPFDSNGERQIAIWQLLNWGIIPKEGINCHIQMNGGEIDFRPFDWSFIEFHPWDKRLSKKEYYEKRCKILDENGYKNCELIVITSIEELKKIKL